MVLVLIVILDDLMRACMESCTLREKVCKTGKLEMMTVNIHISEGLLILQVVNDIIYGREKGHNEVVCFGYIGLLIRKQIAIVWLIILIVIIWSTIGMRLWVRRDVVYKTIGFLYLSRENDRTAW